MAVVLAAGLSGCTGTPLAPPTRTAPTATEQPDAAARAATVAAPDPSLADLPPGTLVAAGDFAGRGTTGRIEIRSNGDDHGFDVTLIGMSPLPAAGTSLELNALPVTASDTDLRQGFSFYTYGALQQLTDQTLRMPGEGYGGFETNDPSYMRSAVIWAPHPGAPVGLGTVVATAPLTWQLPDLNPGLAVVDHGSADGARGEVTIGSDGTPSTYRVAWGDTAGGISDRFGLNVDDLAWLNPDRMATRIVLADLTINLSRENRGLPG